MRIVIATGNPHKVSEIRAVLAPMGFTVVSLAELETPMPQEPAEPSATFEENARIKARYYAAAVGETVLADDSGLEVDALQGAPGVHSAHWAGHEGSRAERDARNNAKLVAALRGVPVGQRRARFVCTMCVASAAGTVLVETRGEFEGVVIDEPRGSHGFGYDPHLMLPEFGVTSAELAPARKNELSHRGRAVRQLAYLIKHKRISW
ncbi:MAG: RdgB/HAM1 family non-canonical purine NTP pyrophosphatase [Phycisphaerae bacterium]|nr:RdgB/HAM1 family non-canonical purine NTP pyrophosphatase [Phycisphaerae bacterium]